MVLLEKKKFKYTEISRNTDTLFEYMPYIENYCFKFQKLPLQLMKLAGWEHNFIDLLYFKASIDLRKYTKITVNLKLHVFSPDLQDGGYTHFIVILKCVANDQVWQNRPTKFCCTNFFFIIKTLFFVVSLSNMPLMINTTLFSMSNC